MFLKGIKEKLDILGDRVTSLERDRIFRKMNNVSLDSYEIQDALKDIYLHKKTKNAWEKKARIDAMCAFEKAINDFFNQIDERKMCNNQNERDELKALLVCIKSDYLRNWPGEKNV